MTTPPVLDAAGGMGALTVTTQPECAWTATTQSSWIADLAPTSGQGNGQVTFRAAPNPQASAREADIVINDARARVTQQASACHYTLSPGSRDVSAASTSGNFEIAAQAGCSWTAVSAASWISLTGNASGTGGGSVSYSVAANTGAPRSGGISVAGETFVINQGSGIVTCGYTLGSTSLSAPAAGTTGSVTVTAGGGCTWTATSNAPWITVTGGASGNGSGTVSFTVAASTGAARSGTISIAGQAFTVNQADGTPACSYQLSSTITNVGAGPSGGHSVNVTAGSGCAWTATSNASWIMVTAGASGSGNGTVRFNIAANNSGGVRFGTLTIAGQTVTVEQAAQSCSYSLSATTASVGSGASTGHTVNVTAGSGCAWTATSNASWIGVTDGTPGSGNGTVTFRVDENTGSARSGTITIAGQTFTVNQAAPAPSCTYQLSATTASVGSGASTGHTVNVTAGSGCAWTATSNASWIAVTNGTPGSGNGTVTFRVDENTGSARSGTITIAGQTFTVNQAAPAPSCTYQLSATTASVGPSASTGHTVNVAAANGCAWTASSNASWIAVTNGTPGSGNGTVTFRVDENTGSARSGTITIAEQTFTVNQAAPAPSCTYQLSATTASVGSGASTGHTVNVVAGSGCAWTATSNASWIAVTDGTPGSGNGTVAFRVDENTGSARSGTVTIAGQTFTVNQAAAAPSCVYTIDPQSIDVPALGAIGRTVTVTTGNGCAWTATSHDAWIVVTLPLGGGGTGPGSVTLTVLPNPSTTASRTGTVTIAGQTLTVEQEDL